MSNNKYILWKNTLEQVSEYIDTNNKLPSSNDNNIDIKLLGKWILRKRQNYKNKNEPDIMANSEIKELWENFISRYSIYFDADGSNFQNNLQRISEYIDQNKKLPCAYRDNDTNIKSLGKWLLHQKKKYSNEYPIQRLDFNNQNRRYDVEYPIQRQDFNNQNRRYGIDVETTEKRKLWELFIEKYFIYF